MSVKYVPRIRYDMERLAYGLLLYIENENGSRGVIEQVTVKEIKEGSMIPREAILDVDLKGAQELMDDLWDAGLRPSKHRDTAGEVHALRNNIGDLNSALKRSDAITDRLLGIVEKGPVIIQHPERKIS